MIALFRAPQAKRAAKPTSVGEVNGNLLSCGARQMSAEKHCHINRTGKIARAASGVGKESTDPASTPSPSRPADPPRFSPGSFLAEAYALALAARSR